MVVRDRTPDVTPAPSLASCQRCGDPVAVVQLGELPADLIDAAIRQRAAVDPALTPACRQVLDTLLAAADDHRCVKRHVAWLARATGIVPRTVQSALRRLEARAYIHTSRLDGERGRTPNSYELVIHQRDRLPHVPPLVICWTCQTIDYQPDAAGRSSLSYG